MTDTNNFSNTSPHLSNEDFKNIESQIGFELPPAVRTHYLNFNGGEPEKYIFPLGEEHYVVQEFFSIHHGKPGHTIEDNYSELVKNEQILPLRLVPFAIDPAGDFYCFDSATGYISIFRAEFLPDVSKCNTPLATTMSDFVAGLVEDTD